MLLNSERVEQRGLGCHVAAGFSVCVKVLSGTFWLSDWVFGFLKSAEMMVLVSFVCF